MPGYSGTPLARKLGIREGAVLVVSQAPPEYGEWLHPLPAGARVTKRPPASPRAVHLFRDRRAELAGDLERWRQRLHPEGFLWVSWPKRASGVPTDVTEDGIRELALPLGFVDVKVCAVSDVWSGLQLVVRRELRGR